MQIVHTFTIACQQGSQKLGASLQAITKHIVYFYICLSCFYSVVAWNKAGGCITENLRPEPTTLSMEEQCAAG